MSTSGGQTEALRLSALRWARFAAWESQAEACRHRTLSADLAWLADAMALARRFAPEEHPLDRLREKTARLAGIRAALSVFGRIAR